MRFFYYVQTRKVFLIYDCICFRLPEGNPYDVLLTLFGRVGAPFFKTLKDSGNGERDGDKLAASVEKSLNEVNLYGMSCLNLH